MTDIAPVSEIVDGEAVRIGQLYVRARSSIVVSVKYLMECGRELAVLYRDQDDRRPGNSRRDRPRRNGKWVIRRFMTPVHPDEGDTTLLERARQSPSGATSAQDEER